jgi:CDP-L-myo-inositol myo-inositolphosphotransferase
MKKQINDADQNQPHTTKMHSVKHAVILAAGKSSRFREKGIKKPKVLLPIGGLRLMERAILTLKAAGVEHFRIVLGAYREQIYEEMSKSPRIQDVDVTFVQCPDFEKGNGVSFGAGAEGIEEPFFLTMCDHIFDPKTIVDFGVRAMEEPHLPALSCDPKLDEIFDMDDATKVLSKDGKIGNIGKEIEEYDLVDTGLFYFPAGYGNKISDKVKAGALSVSNVIQQLIDETGVRATSVPNAVWQDVDYPGMKAEAERQLMKTIADPNDGWVSRYFNRFFSTRLSLNLANWGVTPNMVTTVVMLMTLLGAFFAGSGNNWWIIGGAIIFQLASILDGCDGELARLTYKSSYFGAWYSRLIGTMRHILFFGALGVSAYRVSGSEAYYFGIILFAALSFYMLIQVSLNAYKQKKVPDFKNMDTPPKEHDSVVSDRFFSFWRAMKKDDVITFVGFLLCISFLYQFMFWLALVGTVFMAISISRAMAKKGENPYFFGIIDPIFFYLLGVVILSIFFYSMELDVVAVQLYDIGNAVFVVFATAILWIIFDTLTVANLLKFRVPFIDLLYNQLVGSAYNTIIPLAGLGGEPWKVKHLTQWMSYEDASRTSVQDRLIHSQSGIIFSAITLILTLNFVTFPVEYNYLITPLTVVAVILSCIGLTMMWLTMSKFPSMIAAYILKKLKLADDFKMETLPPARFLGSLFFKLCARFLNLLEIYAIFTILSIDPAFIELVMVASFISVSAVVGFVIPQGMGVNEFGIASALSILGYAAILGGLFGAIRRARMIFWAMLGVGLHFVVAFYKKKSLRWQLAKK